MTRLRAERLRLAGHRDNLCRSRRRPRSLWSAVPIYRPYCQQCYGKEGETMTHRFQSKDVLQWLFTFLWEDTTRVDNKCDFDFWM